MSDLLIHVDIETIPDGEKIDPSTLTPPGNITKQESISKWYAETAPKLAEDKYLHRSLDSMQGQILCVGWAINDEPARCIIQEGVQTEEDVLRTFQEVVKEVQGQWNETVQWVGWNNETFDIPYIWRRSIKYNLNSLRNSINRTRGRNNIIDLMRVWGADFKDFVSMENAAKFLGLEGKGMDGSMVYGLYLEGKTAEIADYCKHDVELTREIYRRIYR